MNHTLVKYLRDKNGQRCGSVVAVERPEHKDVVVAFAACHKGKDIYNQELGTKIAIQRALKGHTKSNVPSYAIEQVEAMYYRARSYFQRANKIVILGLGENWKPKPPFCWAR